ncbi:hypothetical protein LCL95_01145 [Bacillus timonensis]|nr:hypothetical protein [Bacillus timonensis]
MTTENNNGEKKKISLQEAMKQKLAAQKQEKANDKGGFNGSTDTKKLKSQQTKKISNQRRKMGV